MLWKLSGRHRSSRRCEHDTEAVASELQLQVPLPRRDKTVRRLSARVMAICGIATLATFVAVMAIAPAKAQFLSAILGPLLGSWIEGEVDDVDNLSVRISGRDDDILNGQIARAEVSGDNLRYQGFYISRVELDGENIRINANEALRGESLRLQEPLPVAATMRLSEADLNRSLEAPLLQEQLAAAEVQLPFGSEQVAFQLRQPKVNVEANRLQIDALLDTDRVTGVPISFATDLQASGTHEAILVNPVWLTEAGATPIAGLAGLALDLGPDVTIQDLALQDGELIYRGILTIQP